MLKMRVYGEIILQNTCICPKIFVSLQAKSKSGVKDSTNSAQIWKNLNTTEAQKTLTLIINFKSNDDGKTDYQAK